VAPHNIWLTDRRKVKLGDFDSAVVLGGESGLRRPITSEGYASPEERHGDPVDQRSDLYSLGGVLMSLALGERAVSDPAIVRQRRRDLPPAFHDLLASLVAPSPEDRPASAQDVLDRLNEIRRRSTDIHAVTAKGKGPQVESKASKRLPRGYDPSLNLRAAQRPAAWSPAAAHRQPTDREFQPGDVLRDRFEVQKLLHRARDKTVYLGFDREFDCQVTIDAFASNEPTMPSGMTMAAWETRVLGKLGDHPNIARVVHHWEDGDMAVMVNRYLSGGSLEDLLSYSRDYGTGLPIDRILLIAKHIASGLAYIHKKGILYRDLRPRNVRFDEFDRVRLVDFDTAVPLGQPDTGDLSDRLKAEYMAPEVADGRSANERADLYSLGATMYELAAGHPPFAGTYEEIVAARRAGPPPPLQRDDLPVTLRELIFSLLSVDPEQRPASATEVVDRLDGIRAESRAAVPTTHDKDPLPEPDPAEVRTSAGVMTADYAVGDRIEDRFEILEIVDQGGFSKVYRVHDEVEGEVRAFKLFDNAAGYEAVRRELTALRKIRHPNVVEVFWAHRTSAGEWYLISEFIEGDRLDEFTSGTRRLRDREAADVVLDLLDALVAFHPDSARLGQLDAKNRESGLSEAEFSEWMELKDKGLVHRDIKPRNVILTRTGAKLLDFNIASRVGDPVRTQSGTPPYQPPDADLTHWDVSPDLFAVGVILYELLCDGHHPYPNARPMLYEPVINPRVIRSDLKQRLAGFLLKACAPVKADRFATAAEMQAALRNIRADL
jgi:serine/threonine protein kinase